MNQRRTLLKGGIIVSMDPEIGELPKGDILIEGGKISAVGPELEASGADVVDASERIVIPGFVDAHRHVWQGAIKDAAPNTDLGDYFGNVLARLAPTYRPEDVYAGNFIGPLEALDSARQYSNLRPLVRSQSNGQLY